MIINLGPTGKRAAKSPPVFTYTGAYSYKESVESDGTVNWEIAFTSGGDLVFQRVVPKIDVFMIGSGASGNAGAYNSSSFRAQGGTGGAGGTRRNLKGDSAVSVATQTTYTLVIGANGTATSGFSTTAAGGNGRSGGTGAYSNDGGYAGGSAGAATAGEEAFADPNTLHWPGYKYGAGGGGGGARNELYYSVSPGKGGTSGAGDGGAYNARGGNAVASSGSGGGGGGYDRSNSAARPGGTGGSGIIIIRNAR